MIAKPTQELVLEVQHRKATAKAAATHADDTMSDIEHEVAQVLDKAPLVQFPEPFPGDYPFIAIQRDFSEMQRTMALYIKALSEHLSNLERYWPRTEGGKPVIATGGAPVEETATVACDDYTAHRSSHRRTNSGWECDICSAKAVKAVAAALGDDVAITPVAVQDVGTPNAWVCPEHHRSRSRLSRRTGKEYLACPEAECVEREP